MERERQPERGQIIGTSARVAGLAAVATLDVMQARQTIQFRSLTPAGPVLV